MGNTHERHDIIVIGAGLVGLSTAYHLQKRFPDKRIFFPAIQSSDSFRYYE